MASQHTNLTSVVRGMPVYGCNHENAFSYTVLIFIDV